MHYTDGRSFIVHLLDTHVGLTKLCSTKVDSQITNKMQVLGILSLSAWKIVCWAVGRDIHSIWTISKPALDIEWRWERLLTVSASHLWVSPCDFPPRLTHKVHTKYLIFNTLSVNIKNTILFTRRDMSIHCSWSIPKPSLDMYCVDGMSFFMHLSANHESHRDIFHQGWLSKCTWNAKF